MTQINVGFGGTDRKGEKRQPEFCTDRKCINTSVLLPYCQTPKFVVLHMIWILWWKSISLFVIIAVASNSSLCS